MDRESRILHTQECNYISEIMSLLRPTPIYLMDISRIV